MAALEGSIRQRGQIQPGLVMELDRAEHDYELVDGQRRWTACQRLGIDFCAVIIEPADKAEQYEISVTANFQSSAHTPMEIARACTRLYAAGRSETYIGTLFGKSPFWVGRYRALMGLIPEFQDMLDPAQVPDHNDRLPVTLAQNLGRLDVHSQKARYKQIQRDGIDSVKATDISTQLRDLGEVVMRTAKPASHGRVIDAFLDRFILDCAGMQRRLEGTAGLIAGLTKSGKLAQIHQKTQRATLSLASLRRLTAESEEQVG
jgi:ParB family chromosome partitioning protein